MTAAHGNRGFTLVEVMVATAVFATVVALAAAGLRLAQSSAARAQVQAALEADLRLTRALLTRSVVRAHTALTAGGGRATAAALAGTRTQLNLVARRPARGAVGALYRLQFRIDPAPGRQGTDLLVTARPFAPAADAAPEGHTVRLLSSASDMAFSYLPRPEPNARPSDAPPVWLAEWPEGIALPALIRLRIDRLRPRDQGRPVEIILEPGQTLPGNCLDSRGNQTAARLRSPCL